MTDARRSGNDPLRLALFDLPNRHRLCRMEKVDAPPFKGYRPLVVWADNLKEIISELGELCSDIELIADNVKYESVEEFASELKGGRPRSLKVIARAPYTVLELSPKSATLFVSSGQPAALGVFTKIESILHRVENKPAWMYNTWFVPLIIITVSIVSIAITKSNVSRDIYNIIRFCVLFLLLLLFIACNVYAVYVRIKRYYLINSTFLHQKQGFLKANFDKIILSAISAIIGGFIFFGFTMLSKYLEKASNP